MMIRSFLPEVKPSLIDGQGLFAVSTIPARSKIGEFTGELISVDEARRRALHLQRIKIVELDHSTALNVAEGNEFKYVNHSCSPNTYMRVYNRRIEFYSLREIGSGEELTCNYGETHHDGTLICRCGSANCRERL
jgi:uncharacterized protein